MTDDLERLKSALEANRPQPPAAERNHAVATAMAAFDRHHQGIGHGQRQKGHGPERGPSWLRRIAMPIPRIYLAAASTAVVLVAAVGIAVHFLEPPQVRELRHDGATGMLPTIRARTGPPKVRPELRGHSVPHQSQQLPEHAGRSVEKMTRQLRNGPSIGLTIPGARDAAREPSPPVYRDQGRDRFSKFETNPVRIAAKEPVSTFSIDVDTASYGFMRASLNRGVLPPRNAVRTEELVNYFPYGYAAPKDRVTPFAVHVSLMPTPWNEATRLMHIGIKGYAPAREDRPRANLVFLVDTSGSMDAPNKLPLVVTSLKLLLGALKPDDRVAIVTYAGSAGTALEPTGFAERARIVAALDNLGAEGSTAGAEGIRQAYLLAERHFMKDGINRVILATDGDFNVGIADPEQLEGFIARKRASGVYLSVLGFGMGNYNDDLMQRLAQTGNGNAAYIDSLREARKVLVEEAGSTLIPIAKDVKIQVEFNPALIGEYRLIGYETRKLKREDFRNDKVDAGEIGAGHTVTALYEIAPAGSVAGLNPPLRYRTKQTEPDSRFAKELATVSVRYKKPDAEASSKIVRRVTAEDMAGSVGSVPLDVRFAAAVAAFGQLLRGGRYTGKYGYDDVIAAARAARGDDQFGYRAEFIGLVRLANTAAEMELLRQQ